jgi:hypothetical protein
MIFCAAVSACGAAATGTNQNSCIVSASNHLPSGDQSQGIRVLPSGSSSWLWLDQTMSCCSGDHRIFPLVRASTGRARVRSVDRRCCRDQDQTSQEKEDGSRGCKASAEAPIRRSFSADLGTESAESGPCRCFSQFDAVL